MPAFARAGLAGICAAVVFAFAVLPVLAADKAFQNAGLDSAAIKLEAQIKNDAGTVTKTPAVFKREADAAFRKKDYRTGMVVLGQLVTASPQDAANWLRLARTICQIRTRDAREQRLLLSAPPRPPISPTAARPPRA